MRNSKEKEIRTSKSEVLRKLRTCRIVLSDIALDSHIVELYPELASVLKQLKEKQTAQSLLCITKSKSFSNNVCLLQSEGSKKNTASQDQHCIVTRSHLRNKLAMKRRGRRPKVASNDQHLDINADASSNSCYNDDRSKFILSQQLASETSSEFFSSRSSDKTFVTSTSTSSYSRTTRKRKVQRKFANFGDIKSRLRFSSK